MNVDVNVDVIVVNIDYNRLALGIFGTMLCVILAISGIDIFKDDKGIFLEGNMFLGGLIYYITIAIVFIISLGCILFELYKYCQWIFYYIHDPTTEPLVE